MPYKFHTDNMKIKKEDDKRCKLTDSDKEAIKLFVSMGKPFGGGQRAAAKKRGVSRRLIGFIANPETLEENKKRREERGGSKVYYNKEKHRKSMKTHRVYKKKLYDENKLVVDT